jgi:hypothetical protein
LRLRTGAELADVLLSSGEDARTGPGARTIRAGVGLALCARDMRPPAKTPGGRRQDCPARGRAGGASHVSSRLRVLGKWDIRSSTLIC